MLDIVVKVAESMLLAICSEECKLKKIKKKGNIKNEM
jgi:hypothetical protein